MLPIFHPFYLGDITGFDYFDPPPAFITADRKLFKVEWRRGYVAYHLPETWASVRFETLEAAYHAAYGRELEA